jgi:prolyl oligopeptidase
MGAQEIGAPPIAEKIPVTDTYHGVSVVDDYRWLENGEDPKVKAWVAAQNAYTHSYLSKLPQRPAIVEVLKKSRQQDRVSYFNLQYAGGKLFALKHDPEKSAASLVVFSSPDDIASERTVIDLNTLESGKVYQASWYKPSPDGHQVGMALGVGGSEDASLYVFNVTTGKQVGEVVPRVQFATGGGDMAWKAGGAGFFYTRYPQGNERPREEANFYQQVYFHRLHTPAAQDSYVLGQDFPRIAETTLETSPDGKHLLVTVANGDGGEYEHFVIDMEGAHPATQVTQFSDKIVDVQWGADGSLWLLSQAKSNRGEIERLAAGDLKLADAATVVAPMQGSLEGSGGEGDAKRFLAGEHSLYVTVIDGGPEEILKFDLQGKAEAKVPVPDVASVSALVPLGGDAFLYEAETYTQTGRWFRYSGQGIPASLSLNVPSPIHFDDIEVKRAFAASKDGTQIPMTIMMRKGTKLDGTAPAYLTGYGGFALSTTPSFLGSESRLWFDQGGIVVEANLRGGAEYGEDWHVAGKLRNKQNVFDDFAACAQYLIGEKYTSAPHLVAIGGSNGGLLMGAELTQHPELFHVVLSFVGIYDMLRLELDANGSFNTTEYGTIKDPAQFKALYAYSPYHHVTAGVKYPAVLFITGDNDHRVNPANSRKMTAALQAATASGYPVMLRTNGNAGHGISTNKDEALEEQADIEAFLFAQLGIEVPANSR